jgi:hypothetical protein
MRRSILAFLFIAIAPLGLRAEDNPQAQAIFGKLLAAQTAKDYNAFIADADGPLKAALTPAQFNAAADALNPRFKTGYDVSFLGELNQEGFEVYLFRLRFKDGGSDLLGTLSLKDGKVAGIYFH